MAPTATVLLVDDDTDFLRMAARRMESRGSFDVRSATSAEEALGVLDEFDVDCVVSDSIRLPSGELLVAAVRERNPDMPLFLYTGHDWSELADEAKQAGVVDYIQKGSDDVDTVAHRVDVVLTERPDRTLADVDADLTDADAVTDGTFVLSPLDLGASWEIVGQFDPTNRATDLDVVIVDSLAEYLDTDPDSFAPLYDSVDADAVESLVLAHGDEVRDHVTVRFTYAGEEVAVTSEGHVAVRN